MKEKMQRQQAAWDSEKSALQGKLDSEEQQFKACDS